MPTATNGRALLIGVPVYRNKRPERRGGGILHLGPIEMVDKSMPSARADVAAFKKMLISELQFSEDSIMVLQEEDQTTGAYILEQLQNFFSNVPQDCRLVLYYSGHAARISATGLIDGALGWKDEVLCPSDTDWKSIYVSDHDVMRLACEIPRVGATLEIVLETCSASGLNDGQLTRHFGRNDAPAFAPENRAFDLTPGKVTEVLGGVSALSVRPSNPAMTNLASYLEALKGRCVFWGASHEKTCSYSGPHEPDGHGESMGLFTRFFIEGRASRSRIDLEAYIRARVAEYRTQHRAWHAEALPDLECMRLEQQPYVDCFGDQTAAGKPALTW